MDATLERIEQAQRSIAPGLDALVARHLPPPDTVSLGARPMAVEVSALPQDQPAIQSAASEIASDVLFRRELNAEFRRLERARQQSQTLRDGLQAQLEKLQRMAQA